MSAEQPRVCRFYLQGRCRFGRHCRNLHQQSSSSRPSCPSRVSRAHRPQPPPSPFVAPQLPSPGPGVECVATSSSAYVASLPSVPLMLRSCAEIQSRTSSSPALAEFARRQRRLQAIGVGADRKARDDAVRRDALLAAHERAFEFVAAAARRPEPLTLDVVLRAHDLLMHDDDDGGRLRTKGVRVGGVSFPPFASVPNLMERMLDVFAVMEVSMNYSPFARAAWLCFALVEIHPFVDGNGRISRLLLNYALQRPSSTTRWRLQPRTAEALGIDANETLSLPLSEPLPFAVSITNSPSQRRLMIAVIKEVRGDRSAPPDVGLLSTVVLGAVYQHFLMLSGVVAAHELGVDSPLADKHDHDAVESAADTPCVICMEVNVHVRMACCKQSYHLHCLYRWARLNPSCPSCRNGLAAPVQDVQAEAAAAEAAAEAAAPSVTWVDVHERIPAELEDVMLGLEEDTFSTSEELDDNTTSSESDTVDSQMPEQDRIAASMLEHMNLQTLADSSHRTVVNFVRNVSNLLNQLSLRNLRTLFQDMQNSLENDDDDDDETTTSSDGQEDDTQSVGSSANFETTTSSYF